MALFSSTTHEPSEDEISELALKIKRVSDLRDETLDSLFAVVDSHRLQLAYIDRASMLSTIHLSLLAELATKE